MRHKNHRLRMQRSIGHRTATLRNLAKALITHEQIETTHAKAKALRPFVEGVITLGKKGTLHHRRQAFSTLADKAAVHKVFEVLAGRFSSRPGGYTRIVQTRLRAGDAAPMAIIEFVDKASAEAPVAEAANS